MLPTDETQKHTLIEAAKDLAASRSDAGEENAGLAAFIQAFYRRVPSVDIVGRAPAALYDAAFSLWQYAGVRTLTQPLIRILHTPAALDDAVGTVQIVNENMAFLLDSITMALSGFGLDVRLAIHPIIPVERDAEGRLVSCGSTTGDIVEESMMHIEVAGDLSDERATAIVERLKVVLTDVRSVIDDASEMRGVAARLAHESRAVSNGASSVEGLETADFIRWLDDDNFLFFGTREYVPGKDGLMVAPGSGTGLLRSDAYRVFANISGLTQISPDIQAFLQTPQLTMVSKSNQKSSVHRPVPLDTILVKRFGRGGEVAGLRLLLGLFTSASYFRPPNEIPVLRLKVRRCEERAGFTADSHDGKALKHILNTFPRDELFQIDEELLLSTALGVLYLQQRPRIALFVLRDPFERFATCLVYLPRDRYSAEVRARMAAILQQAFMAQVVSDSTHFDETPLARIHFVIAFKPGQVSEVAIADVERQLADAGRAWADRLSEALGRGNGHVSDIMARYATAFPTNYTERFSASVAVDDIHLTQAVLDGAPIAMALADRAGAGLRLKTYHRGEPVILSDLLPMLENIGLRVLNETPFPIEPRGASVSVWIQEFELLVAEGMTVDVAEAGARFEEALRQVWTGAAENDGFNRLVLTAGLSAREIVVLRTYCKHLRQAGSSFSQAYMEDTLSAHPQLSQALVRLFEAQFDPHRAGTGRDAAVETIRADLTAGLDKVENLDEDRIIRSFLLLISKTLRTNFYQRDAAGEAKPYLSIKLASSEIDLLPLPRPLFEIFVYSPRMEGCHLRGGKVARGGIRWSDRKEDFRTEILGLMKAQMVKNAVIVPTGSKGGFVVKRPPEGGRDALMAEVVACYRTLMSGLLDLTDNIHGDTVVPPPDVVRRDPDDPYIVVAADKGTATFSDIANAVAADYGLWIGDAFASGGSVGYDHKAMGITAKGAWEAVKRHFREMGTDCQTTPFTCVGVGDMSGDVFGNGMLLSRETKLLAAFNHMHIFIDPDPDPARSFAERERMFALPRSTWKDYDATVLSSGGGIYERSAKAVALSPEARARFGLPEGPIAPAQLIQALLRYDADLLWFGGIGTYVKASAESQADAGDRTNDGLRVDASSLRAKVIGEGANLAMTQCARIEYALNGGRINTDAIDNSAGVDTSDHEVNIKIAVGDMITAGHVAKDDRAAFLASMTDEVERLVLRDNHLQTLAITLIEAEAAKRLNGHVGLIRTLEKRGKLDRGVEFLPSNEAIAQRRTAGRGLTRPEIAVLLAYAKNGLYDELLTSDLPDAPELEPELLGYFPQRLRDLAPDVLHTHRLRREIVATAIANDVVNRMGAGFIEDVRARTGRDAAAISRAYLIVRDVFELRDVWRDIEALDNQVSATLQTELLLAGASIVEQAVGWFLVSGLPLDTQALVRRFRPGVQDLAPRLADLLPESEREVNDNRLKAYVEAGAPAALAERLVVLNTLSTAMDIVQISEETGQDVSAVAGRYFAAGVSFGLLTLRRQARAMPAATEWQRLAADALIDDSYAQQRTIVRRAEDPADRASGHDAGAEAQLTDVLAEIARTTPPDLAMLTVAIRRIKAVVV